MADLRLLDQWLARDLVRTAIGTNTWEGVEYLDRDAFRSTLEWAVRLDAIDAAAVGHGRRSPSGTRTATGSTAGPDLVGRLSQAAELAGYRLDRLRASLTPTPVRARRPRSSPPRGRAQR
jgi:hypothetical protein